MPRRPQEEAPKVNFDVAVRRFAAAMKDVYKSRKMELPKQLYVSDSFVEDMMGLGRFHGGSSDIDILVPEPEGMSVKDITLLETEIRDKLGESGVDFNFHDADELRRGNAEGRPCIPIPRFVW